MVSKNKSSAIHGTTTYYMVFVLLIFLTIATVALGFVDLGQWHTAVGLLVASCKGALVVVFFMHLLQSARIAWLAMFAGLLWLVILISLTLTDYLTRDWLNY